VNMRTSVTSLELKEILEEMTSVYQAKLEETNLIRQLPLTITKKYLEPALIVVK
jgi:hypothetical protein